MADDPIQERLDIITYSLLDGREDSKAFHLQSIRTQWATCAICVFAVLLAAITIFKSLPA